MQSLIKTCTFSLILAGLTACGGSDGKSKSSSSSSSPAATPVPSSSSSSLASVSSVASSSSSVISESTLAATDNKIFSVAEIENCGKNITAPPANTVHTIFADYDANAQNQSLTNFGGWNHVANGNATEWQNIKHPSSTYNFNSAATVNDTCNSVNTINMVLVKKIADWEHQHANGFNKTIKADGKKFGDIENIVLDIKINSGKTSIPTVKSLKDIYVPTYVNEAVVDKLESGKVNLGIFIYDGNASTVLSAWGIIELDQATLSDKWIRITVPMKGLKFCSTASYNCTSKTAEELSGVVIDGIQFVAETKTGEVLRNTILDDWSSTTPETFKEVDLSFKKIELQLK